MMPAEVRDRRLLVICWANTNGYDRQCANRVPADDDLGLCLDCKERLRG